MTKQLLVHNRGPRGFGIRDLVLLVPSVGCMNRTVELAAMADPSLRYITHQNGCGQLGGDLAVTRDLLARTCAHPNVRGAVVLGLGCESNQADALATMARGLGAEVFTTVLQTAGGVDPTLNIVNALVGHLPGSTPRDAPTDLSAIRVGLVVDSEAGPRGSVLVDGVISRLEAFGLTTLRAGELPDVDLRLRTAGQVEELTLLAAAGAHLCVFITGRANPTGSPVMPTIKVGTESSLAMLLGDTLDVQVNDDECVTAASERIVALVHAVAAGAPVAAETGGQRDFAIPRVSPTM